MQTREFGTVKKRTKRKVMAPILTAQAVEPTMNMADNTSQAAMAMVPSHSHY